MLKIPGWLGVLLAALMAGCQARTTEVPDGAAGASSPTIAEPTATDCPPAMPGSGNETAVRDHVRFADDRAREPTTEWPGFQAGTLSIRVHKGPSVGNYSLDANGCAAAVVRRDTQLAHYVKVPSLSSTECFWSGGTSYTSRGPAMDVASVLNHVCQ